MAVEEEVVVAAQPRRVVVAEAAVGEALPLAS
jgi:hypothetical protein